MKRHAMTTTRKWGRYLATAGAAAASSSTAQAAVVYWNPADVTLAGFDSRLVNFVTGEFTNTSGVGVAVEFTLYEDAYLGIFDVEANPLGPSLSGIAALSAGGGVTRFVGGETIGSATNWVTGPPLYIDNSHQPGFPWHDAPTGDGTAGFVGVRMSLPSGTHYGWVGITLNDVSNTLVLKDFAYDNVANMPIIAGVPEASQALMLAMGAAGVVASRWLKRSLN
jgi:hypothetical protein